MSPPPVFVTVRGPSGGRGKGDPMSDAIDEMVAQRRQALGGLVGRDDPLWGLALSGGGIRSATFCLGLVKALAREGLLLRFDLLSTVSGGGFIGATLGRLFQGVREGTGSVALQAALARAETLACGDWLRRHGRYLIPRGSADLAYAAAIMLRNLLGVHIELGVVALMAGCLLAMINMVVWAAMDAAGVATSIDALLKVVWLTSFWATTWLFLPVVGMLFIVTGCTYWASRQFSPKVLRRQLVSWLGWMIALYFLSPNGDILHMPTFDGAMSALAWQASVRLLALAWILAYPYLWIIWIFDTSDLSRIRLRLSAAASQLLLIIVILVTLGLLDRLAWWFAFGAESRLPKAFLLMLAAVVLRGILPALGNSSGGSVNMSPYYLTFANLVGLLLAFALAAWWVGLVYQLSLVHLFFRDGLDWVSASFNLVMLILPLGLFVFATGSNIDFLNLSSLHLFYRARLVRSYLGAGNGERFLHGPLGRASAHAIVAGNHIDDLNDNDDLALSDYAPHSQGGPVHLINMCVNQTLGSPEGGRRDFNVDRRGQLLTVAPQGRCRLGSADWCTLDRGPAMSLGTWTAISGAAFSPGLGSMTRGGFAILAMFSGVRLGYWWSMVSQSQESWMRRGRHFLDKSRLILCEAMGRFRIEPGHPLYLTDGGHFENTGAYALLRERVGLIVLADCGADPDYVFGDLENLVRKARVDLNAMIDFVRPRTDAPDLLKNTFGTLAELASPHSSRCFALARLSYIDEDKNGWLVLVKPNMCRGLPVDLENFKAAHPDFPQQATTDQFFDEAQWESYRRLGEALGSRLTEPLLALLISEGVQWVEPDNGGASSDFGFAGLDESGRLGARLAQRLAAVTVGRSIGFGAALAAVGVPIWQGVEAYRSSAIAEDQGDIGTLREISDKWGQVQLSVPSSVSALAAVLSLTQNTLCPRGEGDRFRRSKLALRALGDTLQACSEFEESTRPLACKYLLDQASNNCLVGAPQARLPNCPIAYWGRDWTALRDSWAFSAQRPVAVSSLTSVHYSDRALCDTPTDWRSDLHLVARQLKDEYQGGLTAALWQHTFGRLDLLALPHRRSSPPSKARTPDNSPAPLPQSEASASINAPGTTGDPNKALAARYACTGYTVWVQIYGPTARAALNHVASLWRADAASPNVPSLEDVYASADRASRRRPQPYAQTTVLFRQDEEGEARSCIEKLKQLAGQDRAIVSPASWQLKAFPVSLQPPRRVIEVWYVQQGAALAAQ